jgi:hypothetical protein
MTDELRRRMLRAGLLPMVLAGCGDGGSGAAATTAVAGGTPAVPATLVVRNNGTQPVRFNLGVDGREFFANDADVLSAIGVNAATASDLDVALAIWRFLLRNRRHSEPYTAEQWGHSPALLLNSIGSGYCDDVAAAFAALGRLAGRETRVWSMNGHVVPEMRVAGNWAVFDPDLEVYYLDDNYLPAGVAELSAQRRLIEQPVLPTAPHWAAELLQLRGMVDAAAQIAGSVAYSSFVADIYGSAGDNYVSAYYDAVPDMPPHAYPLYAPPRTVIQVGAILSTRPTGIYGELLSDAALSVRLPSDWQGAIQIPFVLRAIAGTGQVRLGGVDFEVGSPALAEALAGREHWHWDVEIISSATNLDLEYLLNDTRFSVSSDSVITIDGDVNNQLVFAAGRRMAS